MLPKGKCICMLKRKFCVASFWFLTIVILFVSRKIGFAVKITDVNSDVFKIHSNFRSGIICFIFFYRGLS
jgi:hypothetical protein